VLIAIAILIGHLIGAVLGFKAAQANRMARQSREIKAPPSVAGLSQDREIAGHEHYGKKATCIICTN